MLAFAAVDIEPLAVWLDTIPLRDWPQQHKLIDGCLRPAMVSDPAWHGFGKQIAYLLPPILAHFEPAAECSWAALSVVMPGHAIPSHTDAQRDNWITRVHIPIVTNDQALWIAADQVHRMRPGRAYTVDTRQSHGVANGGMTPRVHLMLDIRRDHA